MAQDEVTQVLSAVSRFLASLSRADVESLTTGERKLGLLPSPSKKTRAPVKQKRDISDEEMKRDLASLGELNSREEGLLLLDEKYRTKALLEKLARTADLHVQRSDNVEMLRSRVIEATIGYRLRSRAIQGEGGSMIKNTDAVETPDLLG
ncbi:hypothetical protein [Longimicrobium sp.]|jgi:hypothetical protein|uniref:hypothetical protein n=1 Tax=Longimicrobium sp. TaxID=2029185 RepID=UPI002F92E0AC